MEKHPDSRNNINPEEMIIGLENRPDSRNNVVLEEGKAGMESNTVADLQKSGKKVILFLSFMFYDTINF